MQQPGGLGSGGAQTHYGIGAENMSGGAGPSMAAAEAGGDQAQLVEAASPISSRPPASAAVNLDELMTLSGAAEDRSGVGGSGAGGNRWPRQETLALLKIRSDMDVTFRDATLKGPLWEDVSRKLLELGYKRSAKKCKEKFENVHKYYKRTKEGRAGRQDGKSYKFFTELEALHGTAATASNVSAAPAVHATSPNPVSIGFGSISNPMPISSYRMSTTIPVMSSQQQQQTQTATATIPVMPSSVPPPPTVTPMDINFSSNSSSSSHGTEDDDYNDEDVEGQPTSGKRKRGSASASTSTGTRGSGSTRKMMEFFEHLMKQVMQKQESMQQKFLEVIEKREQDRTIREEAWKRQEMARMTREHELMTQERSISASRDAAIVAFLQKITGQTIQLPPPVNVHTAPPPPVPPSVAVATPLSTPPTQQHPSHTFHQTPQVQQRQQQQQVLHETPQKLQVVVAVPEQQVPPQQENIGGSGGGGSFEPASSSRWPKAEVLALIKLRSGLEFRYQEAGPKGPLWEEISAGMGRLGYKRSSKRCKEKWENINKYFKKVKESNKKRPEDAKTCPYFHELDALYRNRVIGGGSSSSSLGNQSRIEQEQQQPPPLENPKLDSSAQPSVPVVSQTQAALASSAQSQSEIGDHSTNVGTSNIGLRTNLFGDATEEAAKKPEDIVKELMEQQQVHGHHHQQQLLQPGLQQQQQQLVVDDYGRIDEADDDNIMDQEEDMEDQDIDEEDDDEMEEERKMAYKIEYQKQNTATTGPSSNGGGNGAPSFLAMVQ